MKLLLDTHIFLWSLLEPRRLTKRLTSRLEDPSSEVWISPITLWETFILAEKRRVILNPYPATWIRNVQATLPFREAPLNNEVAIQSRVVDLPHQDPADRFLAATALVYDLIFVTADERFQHTRKVSTLFNK